MVAQCDICRRSNTSILLRKRHPLLNTFMNCKSFGHKCGSKSYTVGTSLVLEKAKFGVISRHVLEPRVRECDLLIIKSFFIKLVYKYILFTYSHLCLIYNMKCFKYEIIDVRKYTQCTVDTA